MISTAIRYQILTSDPARTRSSIEKDASVKRDTEYYLANIGKVESIDDFVNDFKLFNYAMKAYGLSDMAYGKAFITKLLEEGTTKVDSMANKLSNPLYKEFAQAFDFAGKGDQVTVEMSATTGTVERYMQQTLENNEGEDNEGVKLALYFKRKASSITSTMGLLGDKAILTFIQTAFGIPTESSRANLDYQVRNLEKFIDIDDLQNSAKVDKLIQRFSVMWDMNNQTAATANPILSLFSDNSAESGFGIDLILRIAKLPRGGF